MRKSLAVILVSSAVLLSSGAMAQDLDPASDTTRYLFDSALYMAAGLGALLFVFAYGLRDVGFARTQNAPAVCLRTIGLISVTAFAFWIIGYNLIHMIEKGGLLGPFEAWLPDDVDPLSLGYASGVHWFFQMGVAAMPAAIVASALSERIKLWPFLLFTACLAGLAHPIIAAWVWGGGYFADAWRVYDFGGAGPIHVAGGAAALAGAIVVGPRPGRYQTDAIRPAPTTALPLAAFAAGLVVISLLLVFGGLSGSFASVEAAVTLGAILTNSVLAVGGAVLAGIMLTQIVYKRAGLMTAINAAVAGLVAISADPASPALWQAAMIGAVGGVIVTVAPPFLDRFRIDDAGFVVPTHFLCGLWGLIIVPWSNPDAWFPGQLLGAAAIAAFSFVLSLLVWTALKYSIGVRQAPLEEPAMAE
ncbi:MAG: ammonium transporter [Hyphococcus sp.]|nr:MAG: ammonium transporter [Marinicaulis sp.]